MSEVTAVVSVHIVSGPAFSLSICPVVCCRPACLNLNPRITPNLLLTDFLEDQIVVSFRTPEILTF